MPLSAAHSLLLTAAITRCPVEIGGAEERAAKRQWSVCGPRNTSTLVELVVATSSYTNPEPNSIERRIDRLVRHK